MKKSVLLLCFLMIMTSCEQEGKNENTKVENEKISQIISQEEHKEGFVGGCGCPSCLGLVDEKDDFVF